MDKCGLLPCYLVAAARVLGRQPGRTLAWSGMVPPPLSLSVQMHDVNVDHLSTTTKIPEVVHG